MLEVGAHPHSLLFRGQIKDEQFSGTAYIFNLHCGQVPFDVKGPILDNNERVVLTGQAQRVGRNCQTHGYYTSNLEFKLLKTTDVAQPAGPAFTTQAAIEESKPEVPWSDAGEPKPSAQPPTTAQAPSVEQPKPDVPAREVGEPKQPGNPSALPSMTDQLLIAAQDSGGQKRLASLLMALSVLLPVLSILFLIGILKSIGRGCANRKRIFGLEFFSGGSQRPRLRQLLPYWSVLSVRTDGPQGFNCPSKR